MSCRLFKLAFTAWKDLLALPLAKHDKQQGATPFELYRRLLDAQGGKKGKGSILDRLKRVGMYVRDDEVLEAGQTDPDADAAEDDDESSPAITPKPKPKSPPTTHLPGHTAFSLISAHRIKDTAVARFFLKNDFEDHMIGSGGSGVCFSLGSSRRV